MIVEKYGVEKDGDQIGPLYDVIGEARSAAQSNNAILIAYVFELVDSEPVEDYTESGEQDGMASNSPED